MNLFLSSALFGFFGGLVRAIVGVMKLTKPKKEFNGRYLLLTLIGSGLIGMFAAMLVGADYRVALLAGYAGIDLIDGLYKAQSKRWGR